MALVSSFFTLFLTPMSNPANNAEAATTTSGAEGAVGTPNIKDPNLKVELFAQGLSFPASMAFVDNSHILVLQKNDGTVHLISNGILQQQPVLTVPVNNKNERGLLGIVILKNNFFSSSGGNAVTSINANNTNLSNEKKSSTTSMADRTTILATPAKMLVFLYFTEAAGDKIIGNRVYRYEWDGQALVNPTLILDLPSKPGTNHQGGKMVIGPDRYLYAITGEMQRNGQLQNIKAGPMPDNTGVIFRVNPSDGSAAPGNPFTTSNNSTIIDSNGNNSNNLSKYYAYGIRNSFGITFDPISKRLWDTENGEKTYDEINVVKPGFNSGWKQIMGPMTRNNSFTKDKLVNFPGSHYSDPVFSWLKSIGITDIEFLNSSKLGNQYTDNIFVGDITSGNLYYFKVNGSRTGLEFGTSNNQTGLSDLVADNKNEVSEVTFGTGFDGITDIETGPNDGYLYVLSYGSGSIYRIMPMQ